jgi:hypothetical protein
MNYFIAYTYQGRPTSEEQHFNAVISEHPLEWIAERLKRWYESADNPGPRAGKFVLLWWAPITGEVDRRYTDVIRELGG